MKPLLRFWIFLMWYPMFGQQSEQQQDSTIYFSQAIKQNLPKYNARSDSYYEQGEIKKGEALFDSLVKNALVGSQFDDFTFKSVKGRKIKLSKIKKPTFIITYASWSVIPKGEIAALNKLAKEYHKDVEFIAVFWDQKQHMKKIARNFSSRIRVCYANERYRQDERAVKTLKHSLGFPTCYFIDENMQVRSITRGGLGLPPRTPFKKALEMNYALFQDRIDQAISGKNAGIVSQTEND